MLDQDNLEGLLASSRQLRVFLSDIAVPVSALHGIAYPAIRSMVQEPRVHGLLLEFDPADRTSIRVTIVAHPEDAAGSLPNLLLSNSAGVWASLNMSSYSIVGSYASADGRAIRFSFAAPLLTDPVREDIRGPKAQGTEQMKVLVARAEALRRNDMGAAASLSSRAARASMARLSAAALRQIAASMPASLEELRRSRRVVVRQASAVAILDSGSWASLVLEDGEWKVAD
ncbi:MAG TPA: hypothetical protein VF628_10265 [Allosphingosinicella sp.]